MPSSTITSILDSIHELKAPVHVTGTTSSSKAFLLIRYLQHLRRQSSRISPVLVLCPNDDAALELCSDLENLAEALFQTSFVACQFPTWDHSPYSSVNPSIQTRLNRVACLSALVQQNAPDILISSVPALSQATLPVSYFQEISIPLQMNSSIGSREALASRLLEAGYLRVDPVEDPGTFAVRGEIIDLYPPDRELPIRIELFGDEIEKLREFDPKSQRTTSDLLTSPILIPPAREVLINRQTSDLLRKNIKAYADHREIHRSIRDPILSSIRDQVYPDHSDLWTPFTYSHPATLLDYLPSETPIVWIDEFSCLQEWDQYLAEQTQLSQEASQRGLILPPVEQLFQWSLEMNQTINAKSTLYLDRISLARLDSVEEPAEASTQITDHHQVFVKNNSDLAQGNRHSLADLEPHCQLWLKQEFQITILASTQSQMERIRFLLKGVSGSSSIELRLGQLSEGFRWPAEKIAILTEGEVLGNQHKRKTKRPTRQESRSAAKDWSDLQSLSDLNLGDAVVHVEHGIGRYQGLVRLSLSGAPSDFLLLEYANKDKLYLPVYRLNVIQKYVGSGEGVALDRLGSQQFKKTKEKVKEAVKTLAIDLVQLYAQRKIRSGAAFTGRDAAYQEFESQFPYEETPDQLKAIDAVLSDLESGRVMDRLVCGDVGYGKTEVAIRAAFKAVSEGKQVAVLVPTTVLAQQHEISFKSRLKDYPVIIESVSRFKTSKEQKAILTALSQGKVDIVIGTHRLLSRDVNFQDLGLVIVDEEHRFGVEHKERLKTLKINTHVLTLTATPIPRTLHMALSGLRDISLINTPPVNRLPIRTYVSKQDDSLIQRAIELELSRGGQVFFLHNRVQTIFETAKRIQELVPSSQVLVAHGQMPESELEKAMIDFYQKKGNILVCTTIIESGLDIPSANTIIVDRADTLGLAQLYQIRGRVGRGQQRAYAYLLIPSEGTLSEDAKKRLEVIQRFVELGSGFSIASHDLEIRGGGDLLGPQQSGNIAAVGFDLYTELLEEAIQELQGKSLEEDSFREPEIKTPFPAFLSESYIPEVHQRLSLYRRFSASKNDEEVNSLESEIQDRFGPLPAEAYNLTWLIRIKILIKKLGIESLTVGNEKASLLPGSKNKLDPARIISLVSGNPDQYQITPDSKLVVKVPTQTLKDLFFGLENLLKEFAKPNEH